MKHNLFDVLNAAFRDVFASIPAPIAPEAHRNASLSDACECCADESLNLPEEAK